MSGFPLAAAAAEVRAAASRHTPEDMVEYGRHLGMMTDAMGDIAEGIKTMTIRAFQEYPLERPVVEAIAELYRVQRTAVEAAAELMPAFRSSHAEDLRRHEQPRSNEQMWNV